MKPQPRPYHRLDAALVAKLIASTGLTYFAVRLILLKGKRPKNPILARRWDTVMLANRKNEGGQA